MVPLEKPLRTVPREAASNGHLSNGWWPMFRKSFSSALLLSSSLAPFLAGSAAAHAESRVALVIGESAYRAVPSLPNPVNNAQAMSKLLTDSGFEVTTASD